MTYRFGVAWRALGITAVVVAITLELLAANEDGKFDRSGVAICAGFVSLGIWCYLYFRRYGITLDDEGLTLDRLWRQPLRVAWREIVGVSSNSHELVLKTHTGNLRISTAFPALSAIEAAAARNVTSAAYGPKGKPHVEQPTDDPTVLCAGRKSIAIGKGCLRRIRHSQRGDPRRHSGCQ